MWKDLTMQQRAELMDIYLGHGITSLDDMRRDYDLRSSNTANTYREGGSIHISPSKKGTFTAAATKHGMGVQEFASKVLAHPENYSPAMRKKANFARNASKWHGLGGNLYDGLTEGSQQMDNSYSYIKPLSEVIVDNEGNVRDPEVPSARGTIQLPEVTVSTPDWKDMVGRYNIASNDAITVANGRPVNTHLRKAFDEGAKAQAAWAKEHPWLETAGLIASAAPLAVAAYPALAGAGELAYPILTNPYIDAGITSAFAGHGLNHTINEGINGWGDAAMTALELTPLGRLAGPMWNAGKETAGRMGNVTREFVKDASATARSYILHPTYQTVYHGSPTEFDISKAYMGTPYDMGLHVGDKSVANIMKNHNGVTYKLRIPKEQAVTSDLHSNGMNHIKTDYTIASERAGYGALGDWNTFKNPGISSGVDWNIKDEILMDALRNSGVEGKNYILDATSDFTKEWPSFRRLRTDENTSVHINPREQLTKNLSESQRINFNKEADKLLEDFNALPNTEENRAIFNTKTANLLHRYGIDVVKYWNHNPMETLNPSWFVTDPSVIDIMPNMSLSKYKSIWNDQ